MCLKYIFGMAACLSFASLASSHENKNGTQTCCKDVFGLNYTLPMFLECKKRHQSNGRLVQTIPKLIPHSSAEDGCPTRNSRRGIPPGHRVCRFPDCDKNLCEHGWCEETITSYQCHCDTGFQGTYCNEQLFIVTNTTTEPTTDLTTVTSFESEAEASQATATNATQICPEDWSSFQDSCYRHYPEAVNFYQALTNCKIIDTGTGHPVFVSIHSDKEMDFIWSLLQDVETGPLYHWIGLYRPDPDVEGPFVWTDGTPVNYTSWYPNQPEDHESREDCVAIGTNAKARKSWNDVPCLWLLAYVCKLTQLT